jgi:MinD-like ATPase involved in chromosome partitioning or flagellar assembly
MLQVTLELKRLESDVLHQQATAGSEEDVSEGFLPSKSSGLIVTRLVDRAR